MDKLALLFSGQGSQYSGMGIKLQNYPIGRETFLEASDISGMDLTKICCENNDQDLANTAITQPALLTYSIATLRILKEKNHLNQIPSAVAGLSVGEYSALVASGVFSFADALKIVKERGRLMAEASVINPGIMVAILGLDKTKVESICNESGASTANFNSPGQTVISGEKKAVENAMELAKKAGAIKSVPLKVEGAFHSKLMLPAESGLRNTLSGVSFSKPKIPFISNVTGDYLSEPEEIRKNLALQLSNSIQWEASMRRMIDDGITTFVEIGPGKVLTGIVRRIYGEAKIFNSDNIVSEQ
jgi:[acyl-carrier-protein] S-malonyltransferase